VGVAVGPELPPTPVDVDKVPERLKGAAMIELPRRTELVIRQAGRCCQDPVVRPGVVPDEGQQRVTIHPLIPRMKASTSAAAPWWRLWREDYA
jgi:hypothetical protein